MSPTFGTKVSGQSESDFNKAVESEKGGAEVFGKRVRGAIPEPSGENSAKKASEFGPRTVAGAHATNHKGKPGDLSVKDLENVLTENPTFFDSLYENELARAGGPRKEALLVFSVIESGPKGAARSQVMDEINALLGKLSPRAQASMQEHKALMKTYKAIDARVQTNTQSAADDTEEVDVEKQVEEAGGKPSKPVASSETAPAKGKAVEGEGGEGRGATADLDGEDIAPETQAKVKATRPAAKKATGKKKTAAKKSPKGEKAEK